MNPGHCQESPYEGIPDYPLNKNMLRTDSPKIVEIPEGLTPEAEEQFKALREENAVLKDQVKQIKKTLRGGPVLNYRQGKPEGTKNNGEVSGLECVASKDYGKPRSLVKVIREFCMECCGGAVNGKKPLKAVRECQTVTCKFHPYRMGTNPYRKLDLSEEERITRAETAKERFRKKE